MRSDEALPQSASHPLQGAPADWPLLPVAALIALSWLAFCWPWLSGAVTIPWDAKAHFQPQIQFLAASIARGEWPFWTPNVFGGHPQIADPQSMMFSPPMLLLALVNSAPSLWAVDATVLLTVLVGGIGVALLSRDFGWHWAAAIIAALAFQFGGAMSWRIQHFGQVMSLAYLPWALLFLRRGLQQSSAAYGAASGFVSAFIVLGRDQVGLLGLYMLGGFVVWHCLTAASRGAAFRASIKPLAVGAVTGLLIVIVPLTLTILLAGQSNRPSIDFIGAGRGSLHPALTVTAAVPHIFGAAGPMDKYWGPPSFTWIGTDLFIAQNVGQLYLGIIPLLLLIIGVSRGLLWQRDIRFFAIAAVVAMLYALGWYTPVFRAMYDVLPGVDLYRRPADATFLVGGLAALMAGYVAHRLFSGTLPKSARWQIALEIGTVAAILGLTFWFAMRLDRIDMAIPPLLLAVATITATVVIMLVANQLKNSKPLAAALMIIAALTIDLVVNNGPNGATALPPTAIDMLQPGGGNATVRLLKEKLATPESHARRDRVELAGLGFHWPNASLTHNFDNTLGYNPVRLRLYVQATGAGDTVGLPDQRTFAPLFPSYRSPLSDLLGLRYIATGVPVEKIDPALKPGDLTLIGKTAEGYIYENPRALPRVLFANHAVSASFDKLLADGVWPDVDLTTTVVLDPAPAESAKRPGAARLTRYTNTLIEIEADSPDGGWVVLSDVWHPWWFAEINGSPVPLQRANVLFRAVAVPAGHHRVQFVFRPFAGALHEIMNRSY